jgi:hypothetical protein
MPITNLLVTPLQKYLVGFALHYILHYILPAISIAKKVLVFSPLQQRLVPNFSVLK